MSDSIEIDVVVLLVRPASIKVSDTERSAFIPRSQILNMNEDEVDELESGEEIELQIPEWLAIDKGFA